MTRRSGRALARTYAVIYNGLKKYCMRNRRFVIGRNISGGDTDIMLDSSLISRRHIEITWFAGRLFLKCLGKNGININGNFRKPGSVLYRLPRRFVPFRSNIFLRALSVLFVFYLLISLFPILKLITVDITLRF